MRKLDRHERQMVEDTLSLAKVDAIEELGVFTRRRGTLPKNVTSTERRQVLEQRLQRVSELLTAVSDAKDIHLEM